MVNFIRANQILMDQEDRLGLVEMSTDRFTCGCWGEEYDKCLPSSPADFLAWIEDEIEVQKDQPEIRERSKFILDMSEISKQLRECGIRPAINRLPWNVKR